MSRCPICGNEITPKFIEKYDKYVLYKCPTCDVYFSDPFKNPGAEWYEKSEMYTLGKIISADVSWHHKQFLDDTEFYGEKLFDIGCGTGIFLNEARKKGYEVWGIDFDKENIKIAKERYNLENVYIKSVEELSQNFSGLKFDIITFFEVLEHLDNPIKFLQCVKSVLKSNGYIALSVPNRDRTLDTLGEGDYPPNHLTRWNKSCLSSFLGRNGFEIIKCVVKKFDAKEVSGYLGKSIRFGIAKKLVRRGIESGSQKDIQHAKTLAEAKNFLFKTITLPLTPFLSLFKFQGTGLYYVGRLK